MKSPIFSLSRRHYVAGAISVICGAVYATTMNPTLSFIDTGELAAVASTLGIAHPTGYPLFTLLGRIAVSIPLGVPAILKLNLWNLVLVAASVGVFFELALLLGLSSLSGRRPKRLRGEEERAMVISSAIGALTVGLSTTVWAQSSALEVYSLHLVMISVVSFSFVKGMEELGDVQETVSRWFLVFLFALGLAFGNHMTTLLLAPAFLYWYFRRCGLRRSSFVLLLKTSPFFVLGLSVYLFLPLRSASGPPLDWGHPAVTERFLWHVSGKQYRSWIFSSFESAEKQFSYFINHFPVEFNWVAIGFMFIGFVVLLQNRKRLLFFILLLIGGCLAYSINYDIHDIDSYFLLAYVGTGLMAVYGIESLLIKIVEGGKVHPAFILLFLAVPALQWSNNRGGVDESENFLVSDYTQNILNSADSNAVIFTYQWDYFVSASYYEQRVEYRRPDVVIIDKELLRRSWYLLQLERSFPWLIERSRDKVSAFLKELWKFEHDVPYDGNMIEAAYNGMINDMILKAVESRPVYMGPEMEPQFAPGFERVPEGLLLRLVRPGEAAGGRRSQIRYRPTAYRSRLTEGITLQYVRMFTFHAFWNKNRGDLEAARKWLERVEEIDPGFPPAEALRRELGVQPGQTR